MPAPTASTLPSPLQMALPTDLIAPPIAEPMLLMALPIALKKPISYPSNYLRFNISFTKSF
jgi:hypothetical protein